MDLGQTYAGEEILVICDRYSNYTWTGKTGTAGKGTSKDIQQVLTSTIGTGLLLVKKVTCDGGTNLVSSYMKEFYKKLGIEITPSAAYHPEGNQLAEGTINRVKRALADKIYSHAIMDILALNMNPRKGQILSPFESLHSLASPVSGIPMIPDREKFLTNRDLIEKKITEHPDLNLKTSNDICPKPSCCNKYADSEKKIPWTKTGLKEYPALPQKNWKAGTESTS